MKHLLLALFLAFTSVACASAPVTPPAAAASFRPDAAQVRFAYGVGVGMSRQAGFSDPEAVGRYVAGFAEVVVKSPPSEPLQLAGEAAVAAARGLDVPDELIPTFAQAAVEVAAHMLQTRRLPDGIRADVAAVAVAVTQVTLIVAAVNQQQAQQPHVTHTGGTL